MREKGQWYIHSPLTPRFLGGRTLAETFTIAFNRLLISRTEQVQVRIIEPNQKDVVLRADLEDMIDIQTSLT